MSDQFTQATVTATPTTVDTSAPTTQVQSAPQPATPAVPATGGQPGSQPGATSGAPGEGWVPSYRIRETREQAIREARNYVEQMKVQYETQLAAERERVRALAGFGPQPNPEVETVKQQFAQLFPGLAKLDDEKVEALLNLLGQAGDIQQQNDHYWQMHGQQSVDKLFAAAEADFGGPLSEDAKDQLHAAFVGYVQRSPENMNAYIRDPQFVSRFWKAWSSNFIEPARRVSAAGAMTRANTPIPQDVPGQIRTTPPATPANSDERLAMAWNAYQHNKRG